MNYIIYFGHFELPDKNALAHRVKSNARALEAIGYKVVLVGYNRSCKDSFVKHNDYEYEIHYPHGLNEWITDLSSYKYVDSILNEHGYNSCKAIIATGVGAGNTLGLIKLTQKYSIPFVSDVVDWVLYSKTNHIYNIIKFLYDYLLCTVFIQRLVKNRIYITSYLKSKYNNAGKNTVVIPSLTYRDDSRFSNIPQYSMHDTIVLCYAGNPGRKGSKDRLDWCVKAFMEHSDVSNALLKVYGMDSETFKEDFPHIEVDERRVVFCGKCTNQECLSSIAESDYFVFARVDNEITRSGFPTKFSEALAVGTPVITTPTSDLRTYLKEGYNGFISAECTYDSFSKSIQAALSLNPNEIASLHNTNSLLDESLWREKLKTFIESAKV